MYFDPGGEGGVIDDGNAIRKVRSMFDDRGRWGVRGVKSGCNGRDQSTCRSCFWKEGWQELVQYGGSCRGCHGCADLLDTIVQLPGDGCGSAPADSPSETIDAFTMGGHKNAWLGWVASEL